VEDGVPFCKHCGAPQIRVITANQSTQQSLNAEEPPVPTQALPLAVLPASVVDWSHGLRSALIAALLSAALGFIGTMVAGPFIGLLAWTLLSGTLAVAIYRRRARLSTVPSGVGIKLGALSGLIGFLVVTLLSSAQLLVNGSAQFRALLQENLRRAAANADPSVQPWVDYFLSSRGMAVMMIGSLVFTCVLFLALSSIGGALGTRISSDRHH
jgi:hypothetical protein